MPCMRFQSTLPARGATGLSHRGDPPLNISIHAPREGSDFTRMEGKGQCRNFNPRSPRGERRPGSHGQLDWNGISIHAPREGSDWRSPWRPGRPRYFNPRSPRGERRTEQLRYLYIWNLFQSTLPARGATWRAWFRRKCSSYFNPRSPRGERQQNVLKYRREFWVKRQLIKQNWET